jgi:hypothetical protein
MFSKIFFIIISLCFVIISLCFGDANAQEPGVHPSYVSIKMRTDAFDSKPVTRTICGGIVANEEKRLVATAWHCVPNQRSIIEKPGIFSISGMNATLVTFSPEADIAIFQVDNLNGLKAPAFITPKKGDTIIASAYYNSFPVTAPMNDRFVPQMSVQVTLDWEGKVAAVAHANRLSGEHYDTIEPTQVEWIIVTTNPAPGFSGGPAFDQVGNFVGIISSGNGGFTSISSSENVTELMKSIK